MSVAELSALLSRTLHSRFSITLSRKIMLEIDVDGDGRLCLLDVVSLFYLTEMYFKGLAGIAYVMT